MLFKCRYIDAGEITGLVVLFIASVHAFGPRFSDDRPIDDIP
jgi:hypothetical protein